MVTRSRAREGRGSAAIREIETRPEPEIINPAEIQVSMSAICEEGLGATRSYMSDTASQYVTADKPETTAAYNASLEINLNFYHYSQTATPHSYVQVHRHNNYYYHLPREKLCEHIELLFVFICACQ